MQSLAVTPVTGYAWAVPTAAPPLTGQAAIVTGGASGIGRAIVAALAEAGAAVVVADLAADAATAVAAELPAGEAFALDVRDAARIDALVARTLQRFGRVDVAVNCAGHCTLRPVLEVTAQEAEDLWRVHALGTLLVCQAAARPMCAAGYGRIVNVVSGPGGYGASTTTAHYQAAKSAQTSFTRSLALALGPQGVTVNAISPGTVATPLWDGLDAALRDQGRSSAEVLAERAADPGTPLGRLPTTAEVADLVRFLVLPSSGAITGEVVSL
jgi:NAD(P)-dependent dehydrogenase (short-subunit alcohol dehydrogenase family)